MTTTQIAIIGAGMAGLACARKLSDAGLAPVLLDKGRGVGGRLSARHTDTGFHFDHGAQYVTGRTEAFRALLAEMTEVGAAASWETGNGPRTVGRPGMNALAKYMGQDLDIRLKTRVTAVAETAAGWRIGTDDSWMMAARLVVTAPAPQAISLLGSGHPLAGKISAVRMAPCLTLMAAFREDQPLPFISRRDPEDPLEWIAQNNTKPGRPGTVCWVAQAGPDWSETHLEREPAEIARLMLPLLCERIGAAPDRALHVAAHRWRYAKVTEPLGAPFARNGAATLYLGGDWCLDARVEAAFSSGTAVADDLLNRL